MKREANDQSYFGVAFTAVCIRACRLLCGSPNLRVRSSQFPDFLQPIAGTVGQDAETEPAPPFGWAVVVGGVTVLDLSGVLVPVRPGPFRVSVAVW